MAIEFQKTNYEGRVPEIWRGEAKILPGGFKLAQSLPVGTVVRRGTPVFVEFSDNRTASICKTATVLTGGTTSAPRIAKGSYFAVGDKITKIGGGASATVNAINTSNADYDVLTLSGTVTGLVAGDIIAETDAEAGSAKFAPNAVVGAELEITGKGIPTLDVAYECVVLLPSLAFPILDEWKTGFSLKNNQSIKLITQ